MDQFAVKSGDCPGAKHPYLLDVWVSLDTLEVYQGYRLLSASPSSGGYHTLKIKLAANKYKTVRRHIIILETFKGIRPKGAVARHLDGNPGNDTPNNLEWGTYTENGQDTIKHGNTTRGSKNTQAKLTEDQIKIIINLIKEEKLSGRAIARQFGVSAQTICDIKKGRIWGWLTGFYPLKLSSSWPITIEPRAVQAAGGAKAWKVQAAPGSPRKLPGVFTFKYSRSAKLLSSFFSFLR